MRIQKDNIVIRSASLDDGLQLNKWWNDGSIMDHAGFPDGLGQSLEDTITSIRAWEGRLGQLCIIEIDGKVVGELSYRIKEDKTAYPGWKICDSDYQNKGYGPKIILSLFEFVFTDDYINSKIPIERIFWDTMLENERAQYVYEKKIGARRLGVRKNSWKDQRGRLRSSVDFEITREEFFNAR